MTLRYRMMVARSLLAQWESATDSATDAAVGVDDGTVSEFTYRALYRIMSSRWDTLTEWLDRTDLEGSSFDPRSDLYLSVSI